MASSFDSTVIVNNNNNNDATTPTTTEPEEQATMIKEILPAVVVDDDDDDVTTMNTTAGLAVVMVKNEEQQDDDETTAMMKDNNNDEAAAIASGDFITTTTTTVTNNIISKEDDDNNSNDDEDEEEHEGEEEEEEETTRLRGRGRPSGRGRGRLLAKGGGRKSSSSPLSGGVTNKQHHLTISVDHHPHPHPSASSVSPAISAASSTAATTTSEDDNQPLRTTTTKTPPVQQQQQQQQPTLRRSTRKRDVLTTTSPPPPPPPVIVESYQGRLRRSQTMPPAAANTATSPSMPSNNEVVKTEPGNNEEIGGEQVAEDAAAVANNKLRKRRGGLVEQAAKEEATTTLVNKKEEEEEEEPQQQQQDGVAGVVTKKLRRTATLKRCEACGIEAASVTALRFGSGRFCSKTCVGLFANKHRHRVRNRTATDGDNDGDMDAASIGEDDNNNNGGNTNTNNNSKTAARKRQSLGQQQQQQQKRTRASLPVGGSHADESSNASSASSLSNSNGSLGSLSGAGAGAANSSSSSSQPSSSFDWQEYLRETSAMPVPKEAFRNAFPAFNPASFFQVNNRLEGIDPRHPSLFCVLSVAQVVGFRIRLHFDGFSSTHDFWTNADSPYLFPCGWTEKTGRRLQMPKGWKRSRFNWPAYLRETNGQAAPDDLFASLRLPASHPGLKRGQKLEAVDKTNTLLTCVASLADFFGDRLLIHFDGWGDTYDFWTSAASPYLHAVGWCQDMGRALSPPQDYPDIENFTWEDYMAETGSESIPANVFKGRPPAQFLVGQKMEAVDRRNPSLLRVATVIESADYRVKLRYDGWPETFDIYVDDDCADIHPCGWATHVGHPLEAPPPLDNNCQNASSTCPTYGCRGVGHVKGPKFSNHTSACGCPYAQPNLERHGRGVVERLLGTDSLAENNSLLTTAERPNYNKQQQHNNNNGTANKKSSSMRRHSSHPGASGDPVNGNNGTTTSSNNNNKSHHHTKSGSGNNSRAVEMADSVRRFIFNAPLRNAANGSSTAGSTAPLSSSLVMDRLLEAINPDLALINKMQRTSNKRKAEKTATKSNVIVKNEDGEAAATATTKSVIIDGITPRLVATWNVQKVVEFVRSLPGCQQNSQAFADEQIDGAALLLLNQADMLKIMNMKLGPVLKIFSVIQAIKRAT